jgi:alkylhydroperoxidase family enzyme
MVAEDEADGELASHYAGMRDSSTGMIDNILRIHGQHPATLAAHMSLYRTLMHGPSPVPRWEREMIAVVVSATNSCHY